MDSPPLDSTANSSDVVRLGLLAHAVARLSVDETAAMRRTPIETAGEPFSVSSLKHFDEQTLAVLVALRAALQKISSPSRASSSTFHDWGVLAAPRYLGRSMMISSMTRYHAEGAWGVSPHMIPYRSLHSISGTVSQFLQMHGPNFGVGGGNGGVGELLVAGVSLLQDTRVPGIWLVASQIQPDQGIGENGRPPAVASCEALALALVAEPTGASYTLEYAPSPSLDFDTLAALLSTSEHTTQATGNGGRLSIRRANTIQKPHFLLPSTAMTQRGDQS